jgi:hypothetical protein
MPPLFPAERQENAQIQKFWELVLKKCVKGGSPSQARPAPPEAEKGSSRDPTAMAEHEQECSPLIQEVAQRSQWPAE